MNSTVLKFSVIVPVFNRPIEVDELLESLSQQSNKNFEVLIIEDGSTVSSKDIVSKYQDQLDIKYFYKDNSGPGTSRNYGFERASGNYFIILDSDCIIPPQYIEIVSEYLKNDFLDAFGGPDNAHDSFTALQKAINYSMTSFFTTGGIRGGGEKMDKFFPRSFNMGISKEVFDKTKGFSKIRFGEDIDLSIRILNNGFKTGLIKEAFVYHKRRTSFKQFFKQVFNSGIARINLYKMYPESLKFVHFFPSIFTLGVVGSVLFSLIFSWLFITPLLFYSFLIFVDATIRNKSITIGFLAILASFCQLMGYGLGFVKAFYVRIIFRKGAFNAYSKNFYD